MELGRVDRDENILLSFLILYSSTFSARFYGPDTRSWSSAVLSEAENTVIAMLLLYIIINIFYHDVLKMFLFCFCLLSLNGN